MELPIKRHLSDLDPLAPIINGRGYIAGGFAHWCLSPRFDPVATRDVDIYCYTEDSFQVIVDNLLAKGYKQKYRSNFSIGFEPMGTLPKITVIIPRKESNLITFGEPSVVVGQFDFTVARCYLEVHNDDFGDVNFADWKGFALDDCFAEDSANLSLNIINMACPLSTLKRVIKYTSRGYKIRMKEYIKIFNKWAAMPTANQDAIKVALESPESLTPEDLTKVLNTIYVD